jgi:hypothetical protein
MLLWLFNKVCDFSFVVSPSPSFRPLEMFKPLWISILLTFVHCRPWSLKQAPLLVEMGTEVGGVLETREGDASNLLLKLLQLPKQLAPLL